jgi:hypothetical protein
MSEIEPTTVVEQPAGTGGEQPTATPPSSTTPATEEKTIELKESDYKNLVAARDRANNISSDSESYVATLAKREGIDEFLGEHKTDFPDVRREDLMHLDDPDALEAEAKRIQRRYEDVVQEKLLNVQKADTPVLSPEDRAAELDRLKKNPSSGSFQRYLELSQNA